jgi:hypothetical protein
LPFLFILPITKLMLPIGSPIAPEVEINIKVLHGDALKSSNQETHCLIGNNKPEMAGFDASNVETPREATNDRMQGHAHRLFHETER